MGSTIPHWLTKQSYLAPHRPAIELIDGQTLTFLELEAKSKSFAKKLSAYGVQKGDHIGILSTNQTSMIIMIHALSYIGAVAVLLNRRLTNKELNYQIKDANISAVLTCDAINKKIKNMNFQVPIISNEQILDLKEKNIPLIHELHLNDPFTIMYTSGTTGNPKGVIHTYGNHWWSAVGSALNLGLQNNDKWLATLPMFHIGGLSIFIRSVIYGIPVLLMERFDAQLVNKAVHQKGVTIISVVTTMLQQIVKELNGELYPETFRCMLLGGGSAPISLLEKAYKQNIPVFQSYGLTETCSQIVTLSPDDAFKKIGSAGKPLFPGQMKIYEPNRENIGEIFVKGPMVTKGYYQSERANKDLFQDGWLKTGDLGYLDEEGFLYVVERRTDLIISGGENIYPSEIENVLMRIDGISEVGVVGKHDETWGSVPVAFIVKSDQRVTKEIIFQHAKSYLANYKIPKEIYFIDALPRNASRKLMRHELVKLL